MKTTFYCLILSLMGLMGPLQAEESPYETAVFVLDVQPWEKDCIFEIISALGELSMPSLIINGIYHNNLGDRVRHVHPMHFIAYVETHPYLSKCMVMVYESFLKWPCFLSEWGQKMSREKHLGSVYPQLAGFANLVGRDYDLLKECVDQEDWNRFLQIVIGVRSD